MAAVAARREVTSRTAKVRHGEPNRVPRLSLGATRAIVSPALSPASEAARILALQRIVGNKAVNQRLAREAIVGQGETEQTRPEDEPGRTRAIQVTATIPGGSTTPTVRTGPYTPKPGAILGEQAVAPSGSPTVHSGGGNDCTPGLEVLDWNVRDDGANWRANVVALNLSGDMHITDWPNSPTAMTVPNTPNPVDGGNINNTPGSPNHWSAVIADIADYDSTTTGGAGANWHSTAASTAHEWAHWNQDYLADAIVAGNWAQTNTDVDALTVPKAANADATAARSALEPQVTGRFNTFVRAVTQKWNPLISVKDKPGKGGRGYAAGMAVLDTHINAVRAYANSKNWTAAATGATVGAGIGTAVAGPTGAIVGSALGGFVGSFWD